MKDCTRCGACCVAPDIAALDKPIGVPCIHLGADLLCTIYETRPDACRAYMPDGLCDDIAAETLAGRVEKYLAIFGLTDEAAAAKNATSMRAVRRLPLL
jgi:uncharacterized protein